MDPNTLENMEGYLLGIGNPLLDISACVKDETLKKYGLKPDDAIMADEKHMPLYKELVSEYQAEFLAGGSVQNSLRVAQWILKKPNICTYFGCVGDDDYAKILKDRATADGVTVQYQVTKEEPTGTCAVLITGNHRSLCANLAAARKFTPDHLDKPECKRSIEKAKIIYVSGFFIAVSQPSILKIAQHAHSNNLPFVLNLSAAFVSEAFKKELQELLPYVDILFGNELEATAFAKEFGFEDTDLTGIALKIAAYPKLNKNRQRVVVLTHGCDPVVLVENGAPTLVPVTPLPSEEIVDTNGAGDAFTGGFLAQLIKGRSYVTCVKCGIYAAGVIIRRSGCSFSGDSEFVES